MFRRVHTMSHNFFQQTIRLWSKTSTKLYALTCITLCNLFCILLLLSLTGSKSYQKFNLCNWEWNFLYLTFTERGFCSNGINLICFNNLFDRFGNNICWWGSSSLISWRFWINIAGTKNKQEQIRILKTINQTIPIFCNRNTGITKAMLMAMIV